MSQTEINKSLQKTLLSPLTHDSFWSQFLEATSFELANMQNKYAEIKNNWNINENDLNNLIRISESFGYTPNLIINNTIKEAKLEIESIPYRISQKTTTDGYDMILNQTGMLGNIFNYYYNDHKLIKMINWGETAENLIASNHYTPFYGIIPIEDISFLIESRNIQLDYLKNNKIEYDSNGLRKYSLDQIENENYWILDESSTKNPSKHLSIEYYPRHYYTSYSTTMGITEKEKHIYEVYIPNHDYDKQSISIEIYNEFEQYNHLINVTISEGDNKEILSDDENILSTNSFYDLKTGLVHLEFNEVPYDDERDEGFEIIIHYNLNLTMDSNYYYYFESEMDYNRRCVIVPHSGVFLCADIVSSKGSDYFHQNEGDYTVEDLKMKAFTTLVYDREKSMLSESEKMIDKFKYICSGNRALDIPNEANISIFDMNHLTFSYNMNADNGKILNDISDNQINCKITGNATRINGIISKSLDFDGNTYCISNDTYSISSSSSYTFGIWFNARGDLTDVRTIFEGFIKITYDYVNSQIKVYAPSQTQSSIVYYCAKNTDYFLAFRFTSNSMVLYINGSAQDSVSFNLESGSYYNRIGTNVAKDSNFCGLIDSLWLINKSLTQSEIQYIYQNKISIISGMGNILNRYRIYDDEKYIHTYTDNEDEIEYMMIQSYVEGMDVNAENIFIIDDENEDEIKIQTNIHPIAPSYFTITNQNLTLKTNTRGEFYNPNNGEIIDGNIDFESGKISLLKKNIKTISQRVIKPIDKKKRDVVYLYTHIFDPEYQEWRDATNQPLSLDYVDTEDAVNEKLILVCQENNDPTKNIYTYDKETYYLERDNDELKNEVQAFIINNDVHVFSNDNGKYLYLKLNDIDTNSTAHLKALHCYVELGELSQTRIYSNNNHENLYLDVSCTKEVNKVTYSSGGIGYVYYNSNGTMSSVYTDLTFTELVSNATNVTIKGFENLIEMALNYAPTEMEVTVVESENWYYDVWTFNYISDVEYTIKEDVIKNTINIDYWIKTSDGVPKKYTAVIKNDNTVSGVNIEEGFYDEETQKLTLTFQNKVESDVTLSYNYKYKLGINYSSPLNLKYKAKNSTKINEIGLENENHELLAYMTFNDVEFNDIYNHISAMFAIRDLD